MPKESKHITRDTFKKSELETDAVRAAAPYTVCLGLNAVD